MLEVTLLSPTKPLYEGGASSVVVPGESGVFEILPFHKRILSRLISGIILIDDKNFPIRRGLIKVNQNRVVMIVEEG